MAESKSPAANPQQRASDLNPSVGSVSERPVQSTQIVSERIDKVTDPPRLTMSDITEQPVTKITSTRVGPPTIAVSLGEGTAESRIPLNRHLAHLASSNRKLTKAAADAAIRAANKPQSKLIRQVRELFQYDFIDRENPKVTKEVERLRRELASFDQRHGHKL